MSIDPTIQQAFIDHENICENQLRLMRMARTIDPQCEVSSADRASIEMLAGDLADTVSTEGLGDMVRKASGAMFASFNKVMDTVGVWIDNTGRKEIVQMRKQLDTLQDGPKQKQLPDPELAESLSIDGRLMLDHDRTAHMVHELNVAFLDEFIPDVSERDSGIWGLLALSGFIKEKPGAISDKLSDTIADIVEHLADSKPPALPLPENGLDRVIGNRSIFVNRKNPPLDFSGLKTDSKAQKVIADYEKEGRRLASLATARHGEGDARVNVVPILSLSEISATLEVMEKICDEMERAVTIRKQSKKKLELMSNVRVMVSTFDTSEIVQSMDEFGNKTSDTVYRLTPADRQRVDLIVRYVSQSIYDSAGIIRLLIELQHGVWESLRNHVRGSMRQYRSS